MNIFFLHTDPQWAANALCDKHVPKMLLESAQMLSTAVHQHQGNIDSDNLYKKAYPNHPMTKWVGFNRDCFRWALENAVFISQEYCKRFKKLHKSCVEDMEKTMRDSLSSIESKYNEYVSRMKEGFNLKCKQYSKIDD